MSNIHDLNNRRAECERRVRQLNMANVYGLTHHQMIALDAKVRLASDAFNRADAEYRAAVASLTTEELVALSRQGDEASVVDGHRTGATETAAVSERL